MGIEIPLNTHIPNLAKQLDHPMAEPMAIAAPSPRPPKDRRPLRYSVTDVEQLMRDPYSHYAKRILGLKKLDSLDRDLEARDFGQLVHQALDDFQKTHGASQDLKLLLAEGHRVFAPLMNDAIVKRFWWPRFEQIAHWLHHAWLNRPDSQVHTELPGSLFLMISDDQIELKTIIDRVEVNDHTGTEDSQVTIIDYKTGALPTQRDVANGLSPQLALESLIFLNGGCGIDPLNQSIRFKESQLTSLQYWYLKGGLEGGEIRPTKNLEELLVSSKQGLLDLLGHFIRDQSPYLCCPWDESTAKGKDFHHLARLKEWNG
jgi:ATP-dependent helicase/nuclease subunit B